MIELLVVIAVIGLLSTLAVVAFNGARMGARDAVWAQDINTIKKALVMYLNDSPTGYPLSISGECLTADDSTVYVGKALLDDGVLVNIPVDPLWPAMEPAHDANGVVTAGQTNFCYFYFSNDTTQYKISYFLESTSKAGTAGINTTTQ